MSQTVVGIFEHANQAQEAKAYLIANGFNSQNIDINTIAGSNFGEYGETTASPQEEGIGDKISRFFSNLFSDENDVSSHIEAARRGTTVTVYTTTENQTLQAVQILDNFGAVDVNDFAQSARTTAAGAESSESIGSTSVTDRMASGTIGTDPLSANDPLDTDLINTDILDTDFTRADSDVNNGVAESGTTGRIPVVEEELQVGKQEVQTGGIRLRSRIVERPVEESVRLREEHVNVEHNVADREATAADYQEGTIEVNETAEVPVVAKEARVVDEVSLNKEVTENEQTINDTVRHTEIDTEDLDDKNKV
jgi:uncharacterized protein (TIGR02271 family)